MDEAEARSRIERGCAASASPSLSAAEIDDLLNEAARPDENDVQRGTVGWIPTWNLAAGIALGWEWKAAYASEFFPFGADGSTTNRDKIFAHCQAMRDHYRAEAAAVDQARAEGGFTIQITRSAGVV